MNSYKFLITFFMILFSILSFGQDKIFKKNGEVIDAIVSKVTADLVVYKNYYNSNSSEYTIPKNDVIKIKYANGSEDLFQSNSTNNITDKDVEVSFKEIEQNIKNTKYRNNISISLQATEEGFGFGINYEQFLDKKGRFSIDFPLIYTQNYVQDNNYTYATLNTNTNYPDLTSPNYLIYLIPGIKINTNNIEIKKTRYSFWNRNQEFHYSTKFFVETSLVIGKGVEQTYDEINNTYISRNRLLFGGMIKVGQTNYSPDYHVTAGYELGIGGTLINRYDGVDNVSIGLAQFSLKLGYSYNNKNKFITK